MNVKDYPAITCDSRKVTPGCLFIAVRGANDDGNRYIDAAMKAGAAAYVSTDRRGLAEIADKFYDHPSGKLKLVGITGTNGKTTTVTLLYHMMRSLGYECGLLSTIANYVGARRTETTNTTSDPITINRLLAEMVEAGCEYCFMEVSSIGVEQERVAFLEFAAGIFSNLTHDHLDYHGTFAEYIRCKKLFFDQLPASAMCFLVDQHDNITICILEIRAGFSFPCTVIAFYRREAIRNVRQLPNAKIDWIIVHCFKAN